MEQKIVKVGNVEISNHLPFALVCGPCQIESKQHSIDICGKMIEITKELNIPYERTINGISAWKRAIVTVAGVTFNFVFSIIFVEYK